jgi:hypothetical protein
MLRKGRVANDRPKQAGFRVVGGAIQVGLSRSPWFISWRSPSLPSSREQMIDCRAAIDAHRASRSCTLPWCEGEARKIAKKCSWIPRNPHGLDRLEANAKARRACSCAAIRGRGRGVGLLEGGQEAIDGPEKVGFSRVGWSGAR